ncbi:MAG: arginine--tRNA ligase, partial [Aquificaceae bacterium]
MKEVLEKTIRECIRRVYGLDVNGFVIDKPREEKLGDLSTNVAFLLSKELKKSPQEVAKELASALTGEKFHADAVKGFINFIFSDKYIKDEFKKLLKYGEDYFIEDLGKGKRIQVEFVSANPTGPLHLGHGRGAVIGDVLANLLKIYGFDVMREYYINDAGYQVYLLGLSILYRYKELSGKEDERLRETFEREGYKGSYIVELAKDVKTFYGDSLLDAPQEEAIKLLSDYGIKRLLEDIKNTLKLIGVGFDVW